MAPREKSIARSRLNQANAAAPASEVVKYIGVRRKPNRKRFSAETKNKKSRVWLGVFDTAEQAALAYDMAVRRFRGARAKTNFPADIPKAEPINDRPSQRSTLEFSPSPLPVFPLAVGADASMVVFPASHPLVSIDALPLAPVVPYGGALPQSDVVVMRE